MKITPDERRAIVELIELCGYKIEGEARKQAMWRKARPGTIMKKTWDNSNRILEGWEKREMILKKIEAAVKEDGTQQG